MSRREGEEEVAAIGDDDLEDNYYSVLNVAKDASDKEITQAYHRLGLVYHPDKHKDSESKRHAEVLFSKVKKAYDVLIDAHKRAIYDSVGKKGLDQDGMQIVIRSKTPQEIREEYERLSKEREEKRLEKLTYSQGHFSMNVDATNIFDSYDDSERILQNGPTVSMGNFGMEQSIDFPISNNDTVTLTGSLGTNEKYGSGSVSTSLRRVLSSDAYLDFKGTLGANKGFSFSAFKRLSQKCTGSANALFRYKNGSIAPIFTGTVNYQLDTNLVGQLKYKTALGNLRVNSAMSSSLIYNREQFSANLTVHLSVKNTFVSASVTRTFAEYDAKLKASAQYGYLGATLSYGIEKQVTKFSRVDATIVINSMTGVMLNLEVDRGTQTFIVPVHLSHEVLPSAIFYGTVTPLVLYYVVKRLIIDPYFKDKEEKEAKSKQEKLKAEILERRTLAHAAQNLMKETVSRIIEREGPNGLVITKAIYGKITDKNRPELENEKTIDVVIPLQFLVKDHTLQILADKSKSNLEGFYDPCIGETKSLYIEYEFKGERYKATIGDTDVVRLPRVSHKIEWWSRPFSSVKA